MRYHVCRDESAEPDRRWLVIDDVYGLVVASKPTKEEATKIAGMMEGKEPQ